MILETKDLILRETEFEDLHQFYLWERTPQVTEFFSIKENQSEEEVLHKYFTDLDDPAAQQFSILQKNPGGEPSLIGRIVLSDIIEGWKAEIWRIYIGSTDLRGKGLGRQAMEAMIRYCFEKLGLQRLYLDYYTGNPARFLYENLGFQHEGTLRDNCRKNGVLYDVNLMSMLRKEYDSRP